MSGQAAPELASNVETFDAPLRLLISIAARAAAASRLPADISVSADEISIVEDLSAFHIEEEQQKTLSSTLPKDVKASSPSGDDVEVDTEEVEEQAKASIAAAAAQAPKISPEEQRQQREKMRRVLQSVESNNSEECSKRKKQARDWADEIARHCQLGAPD